MFQTKGKEIKILFKHTILSCVVCKEIKFRFKHINRLKIKEEETVKYYRERFNEKHKMWNQIGNQ